MSSTLESHEAQRLKSLNSYTILDTESEASFNELCELAAEICKVPMAFIGFIGVDREWFKAGYGWPMQQVKRAGSMCAEAIRRDATYIITDTHHDPIFRHSPYVTGWPRIRYYAGTPIRSREGFAIGALCVLDRVPRCLSPRDILSLEKMARQVEALLELRRNILELESVVTERNRIEFALAQTRHDMERTLAELRKSVESTNQLMRMEASARTGGTMSPFLNTLQNSGFAGIFYLLDVQGRMLGWNRHLQEVVGYAHDDILNRPATDFFETDELKTLVQERIRTVLEQGSATVEANLLTKSGLKIPYYLAAARIELAGGPHVVGMGADISASYRSEETFQLRNRAMQASVNAIIITDLNGIIEYANPAFEKMTGYRVDEILGQSCRFMQGSDVGQPELDNLRRAIHDRTEGEAVLRNYRKNGELFWNDVQIAPVRNDAGIVTHFVGVLNDITELKRYEGHLERQVNFDSLTGLANRNLLKDRIRQAVTHAQRHKQIVTVGFVDLDNFKTINDTYGHVVGDKVLQTVADRLCECVRAHDTVARYGGDEFAFVLTEQDSEENVSILMRRILGTIAQPFLHDNIKLSISCSIGVSFYPRGGIL